jgi:hypothetical protein
MTLRIAAWSFAAATVFGSAISMRHDVAGEPLGIRPPLSTGSGILLGWGAGVAAPWPMPVLAVVAASNRRFARRRGAVCAALGAACVVGSIVEPVTRRRRRWTPTIAMAIGLNLATSAAMLIAGLRHLAAVRRSTQSA